MSEPGRRQLFPAFLDLCGRLCVVIGEGERAERKARALATAGGDVAVIGMRPTESLLEAGTAGEMTVEQRGYVRGDLEGAHVVLCIGQDEEVSRAVAAEARERGCLVNVSGHPELCNFIMPSSLGRGSLQIAVSTGGSAPEAARLARSRMADALGEEWGPYTALVAEVRALAAERSLEAPARTRLLALLSDPALLERVAAGEQVDAASLLEEASAEPEPAEPAVVEPEPAEPAVAEPEPAEPSVAEPESPAGPADPEGKSGRRRKGKARR